MALTRLKAGDSLARAEQEHEYVVLLTDATTDIRVEAGAESAELRERGVIVVPPGVSSVTANGNTVIVRLFDHRTTDLLEKATNSESYAVPHPNVAPLVPWPVPNDGDRLRVYNVDQIPAEPGRFGSIFCTSAFMVNFIDLQEGPPRPRQALTAPPRRLRAVLVAVEGSYVHHIRTPWTAKRSQWRDDEHQLVGSPRWRSSPAHGAHQRGDRARAQPADRHLLPTA